MRDFDIRKKLQAACAEPLEARRLLAASITIDSGGIVRVTGTDDWDEFLSVRYDGSKFVASYEEMSQSFDPAVVKGFVLDSLGGGPASAGDFLTVSRLSSAPGAARPVTLLGGGGDDRFRLFDNSVESVSGGAGNDFVYYAEGNTPDSLDGGSGTDTVHWDGDAAHTLDLSRFPTVENARMFAGTLTGNALANTLTLLAGGTIRGNAGNDRLVGGSLANTIDGGDGNDTLFGHGGRDSLLGGNHNDAIYARDQEIDTVNGGAGTDSVSRDSSDSVSAVETTLAVPSGRAYIQSRIVYVDGTSGNDTISAGGGLFGSETFTATVNGSSYTFHQDDFDRVIVRGFGGNDTLDDLAAYDVQFEGGDGNDSAKTYNDEGVVFANVFGGNGNDVVTYHAGPGTGTDDLSFFDGGAGRDKVIFQGITAVGDLDLRFFPTVEDGVIGLGTLTGNSLNNYLTITVGGTIRGGDGNDTLDGSQAEDGLSLFGENGNDRLIGNAYDGRPEDLIGSKLDGGAGNDTLVGGTGPERLVGGSGTDEADYSRRTTALNISLDSAANDGAAGEGDNVWHDVERVRGGSAGDKISGHNGNQIFYGNGGNDTLYGSGGNDALFGGSGNDRLFAGSGDDYAEGNSGNDTLWGESGLDRLLGHDGNDTFYVRDGQRDTVDGGTGFDRAQRDAIDSVIGIESFIA